MFDKKIFSQFSSILAFSSLFLQIFIIEKARKILQYKSPKWIKH